MLHKINFEKFLLGGGVICTFVGGIALWKDRQNEKATLDPAYKYPTNLENKVYLVTGANSGIGQAITNDLATRKAKIYMLCRDMIKCEQTRKEVVLSSQNKYVYCRQCDLSSQKSIRTFVEEFKKKEKRIDGLINNAGIYHAPRSISEDGVEIHFAVNHLGHFLLTNLLMDMIKDSGPGNRVVFLMNLDYRKGQVVLDDLNFNQRVFSKTDAFNQSQLANMMLVQELSRLFKGSGTLVNAAYPGVVTTNIKRHMGVDKSVTGNLIAKPLLWLLPGAAKNPTEGAKTPLYLTLDQETIKNCENASGKLYDSKQNELEIDPIALDEKLAHKLFMVDEYWTGIKSKADLLSKATAST